MFVKMRFENILEKKNVCKYLALLTMFLKFNANTQLFILPQYYHYLWKEE